MRKTMFFSRVTKTEYEFTQDEVLEALIDHFKIDRSKAKVRIEIYESSQDDIMAGRVEVTLEFVEPIVPETQQDAAGYFSKPRE